MWGLTQELTYGSYRKFMQILSSCYREYPTSMQASLDVGQIGCPGPFEPNEHHKFADWVDQKIGAPHRRRTSLMIWA